MKCSYCSNGFICLNEMSKINELNCQASMQSSNRHRIEKRFLNHNKHISQMLAAVSLLHMLWKYIFVALAPFSVNS